MEAFANNMSLLCSLGSRPAPGATGHHTGAGLIFTLHSRQFPVQLWAFQRLMKGSLLDALQLAIFDKQVYGGNLPKCGGRLREYGGTLRTGHLQHIEHLKNTSA